MMGVVDILAVVLRVRWESSWCVSRTVALNGSRDELLERHRSHGHQAPPGSGLTVRRVQQAGLSLEH
jgi:hypothetical protein